jgi:HEAT repeats
VHPTFPLLFNPAPLTHVLYLVVILMAVILGLLVVLVIVQKLFVEHSRRNEDAMFGRLSTLMRKGEPERALKYNPRRLAHRRALTRALALASEIGPTEPLRTLYPHLIQQLQRDTTHGRWGRRVAAFEGLGMLRLTELRPYFHEATEREDDPRVLSTILQAIARLSSRDTDLHDLSAMLIAKPALSGSFNEGALLTAFESVKGQHAPDEAEQHIKRFIEALDRGHPLLRDAIAAAGRSSVTSIVPLIERICSDPTTESPLRITGLRALGRLKPDHELLVAALADPSWVIRAVCARHLRRTDSAALNALRTCLRDSSHFVRRNAARTLYKLGETGQRVLQETSHDDDPFAREMSHFLLTVQDSTHD